MNNEQVRRTVMAVIAVIAAIALVVALVAGCAPGADVDDLPGSASVAQVPRDATEHGRRTARSLAPD
ncbi:hypothetical protein PV646_20550 [Streptomyces sp. ID05-26A]|nr:hypothetical protein [Streptomyces sp. ID05-26A]